MLPAENGQLIWAANQFFPRKFLIFIHNVYIKEKLKPIIIAKKNIKHTFLKTDLIQLRKTTRVCITLSSLQHSHELKKACLFYEKRKLLNIFTSVVHVV